jgi:hypothetical protein
MNPWPSWRAKETTGFPGAVAYRATFSSSLIGRLVYPSMGLPVPPNPRIIILMIHGKARLYLFGVLDPAVNETRDDQTTVIEYRTQPFKMRIAPPSQGTDNDRAPGLTFSHEI